MQTLVAALLFLAGSASGVPLDEQPVSVPAYADVPGIQRYATLNEYDAARADTRFRLTRVSYQSDGLTVFAYVYAPAERPKQPLPVVVFNRGSYTWEAFAAEYLTMFHRFGQAGFVVVAPMYRGSGGAEGKDEVGGADLADLMNVTSVLRQLPFVTADATFLYGASRGGMMVYQAIRDRFPARAAAVFGGFTNFLELAKPGTPGGQLSRVIWPDFEERKDGLQKRRSALEWPEKIDTPVLIMHGGADPQVSPAQSLQLAAKLEQLGKPYELVIRSGANHSLAQWQHERDALAIEWFRRHQP